MTKTPYAERLGQEIWGFLKTTTLEPFYVNTLGKVKYPTSPDERFGVVYKIKCKKE